jgi:2-polyprenyl-6-methoxyphenol hydroxylase-like FAD-dependent oxidoreductase
MAKQILVIGAGIAGLATAVALQRRGHDVTVIEERTDASSGAGISIWPSALAALDEIAFLSTLASRATVLAPEALLTRHLADVASRSAFAVPTVRDLAAA